MERQVNLLYRRCDEECDEVGGAMEAAVWIISVCMAAFGPVVFSVAAGNICGRRLEHVSRKLGGGRVSSWESPRYMRRWPNPSFS